MKMIVGLGNPGEKYENTRHNAGALIVDKFAGEAQWEPAANALTAEITLHGETVLLVKPQGFMNNSGRSVRQLIDSEAEFDGDQLLVVHDDWAFEIGEYRLDYDRGPNRHNGVRDIIEQLGTQAFWRLRIGIGGERLDERDESASDYVLSQFSKSENKVLETLVEESLIAVFSNWVNQNF